MSVEAYSAVMNHAKAGLPSGARLVLWGIANHEGDGGAWPTVSTLARYTGQSTRQVQRNISRLVSEGQITVVVQGGGSVECPDHDRPNLYRILVTCPPWCDRTSQHRDTRSKQKGLWTNPLTPTSGGDAGVTPPMSPTSPGGVTPMSPKPSIEPPSNIVALPQATTERARRDPLLEPCGICGQTRERCVARNAVHDMGHLFEPTWEKPKPAPAPPTLRSVRAEQ